MLEKQRLCPAWQPFGSGGVGVWVASRPAASTASPKGGHLPLSAGRQRCHRHETTITLGIISGIWPAIWEGLAAGHRHLMILQHPDLRYYWECVGVPPPFVFLQHRCRSMLICMIKGVSYEWFASHLHKSGRRHRTAKYCTIPRGNYAIVGEGGNLKINPSFCSLVPNVWEARPNLGRARA